MPVTKPLQFVQGKWYKTRSGFKRYCVGALPRGGYAFCCDDGTGCYARSSSGTGYGSDIDIVGEWEEPATSSVEVSLWRSKHHEGTITTIGDRPPYGHWILLAKKTVTITEGEGL